MDAASIAVAGDGGDIRRSWSSRLRSWGSFEFEAAGSFGRRNDEGGVDDDEELCWAAIEKLPTYSRARKGVLNQVLENGEERAVEVDFTRLGSLNRRILIENVMRIVEEDNGRLLRRLRARIDGVGIELPTVEVLFEKLSVEADAHVGSRGLPTLLDATLNTLDVILVTIIHMLSFGDVATNIQFFKYFYNLQIGANI